MSEEYNWEDFEKCPIGTKVSFEDGTILIKYDEISNQFGGKRYYRDYEDLKGFRDIIDCFGKIIKIEEPTYTTVYEPKKVTMPEIEEMKRLTDELYKICDEVIKSYEDKGDRK